MYMGQKIDFDSHTQLVKKSELNRLDVQQRIWVHTLFSIFIFVKKTKTYVTWWSRMIYAKGILRRLIFHSFVKNGLLSLLA